MFDTIYNFLSENAVLVMILIFFGIILGHPILFGSEGAEDQDWHDTIN